jgi:hypothetical protein
MHAVAHKKSRFLVKAAFHWHATQVFYAAWRTYG